MLVHPKNLSDQTLYAIDQFILRGGRAMIFVDPMAEIDQGDPGDPMSGEPGRASSLEKLFSAWGISVDDRTIVGDDRYALTVGGMDCPARPAPRDHRRRPGRHVPGRRHHERAEPAEPRVRRAHHAQGRCDCRTHAAAPVQRPGRPDSDRPPDHGPRSGDAAHGLRPHRRALHTGGTYQRQAATAPSRPMARQTTSLSLPNR